jgi:hypothetical protein
MDEASWLDERGAGPLRRPWLAYALSCIAIR